MTKAQFRTELADVLMVDPATLQEDHALASICTWDSLTQLSVIAFVMERLDVQPDAQRLADCAVVTDLLALLEPGLT